MSIHGNVTGASIEIGCFDVADRAPFRQFWNEGRNIRPGFTTILRYTQDAIIASSPKHTFF